MDWPPQRHRSDRIRQVSQWLRIVQYRAIHYNAVHTAQYITLQVSAMQYMTYPTSVAFWLRIVTCHRQYSACSAVNCSTVQCIASCQCSTVLCSTIPSSALAEDLRDLPRWLRIRPDHCLRSQRRVMAVTGWYGFVSSTVRLRPV